MKNETAMRFVADAMLGRLAKWLRLLGYDTLYWRGDDAGLVRLALAENRLLLTRDTRIAPRLPPHLTLLITSDHYDEQIRQVMAHFRLSPRVGRLCLRCNFPLETVDKSDLQGDVPKFVWRTQERFARCPGCRRIYWEGTHYARIMETIGRLAAPRMKGSSIESNTAGGSGAPMTMDTSTLHPPHLNPLPQEWGRGGYLSAHGAGYPLGMERWLYDFPSPPSGGEGGGEGDTRGNARRNGPCA